MSEDSQTGVRIELVGGFRVIGSDGPIEIRSRKARGVLAYVAMHLDRPPTREKLAGLLWPESASERARGSLRQALYVLRKALPEGTFDTDGDMIRLLDVTLDVAELEQHFDTSAPDAIRRLLRLYQGDFLDGFYVDASEFESWMLSERRHLRERALSTLVSAVRTLSDGDRDVAIDAALHVVALEPLREEIHRELMRRYADAGRVDAALQQYRMCEEAVRRELGGSPSTETTKLRNELARRAPRPAQAKTAPARQLRSISALVVGDAADVSAAEGWESLPESELRTAVERFDCEVIPGLPGTVVGCFGLARPRARDVENAATAAVVLRERYGSRISVGLESGQAVVTRTDDGPELAGGPVGQASRLQAAAGAAQIRVGPRASRSLSGRFELEPTPDGARLDDLRTDTFTGVAGPFVGRDMERDLLARALESATTRAVVVSIGGPVGIGKSRLADEVLGDRKTGRVFRLSGHLASKRSEVDPLSRLARIILDDAPGALDELGPDERRLVRALCEPEGVEDPTADRTSRFEQRVEAARLVCHHLLQEAPMVVAIDDAHGCPGTTIRELSELASALRAWPFALLVTTNHGLANLSPRVPTVRLELAPLDEDSARTLARHLAIDDRAVERCVERAGGNPLFLERLADLHADEELPHTVQSTVLAAMERFSARQQELLEAAAVLGEFFTADQLSHVVDTPVDTAQLLATALVRLDGTRRYAFVHSVARDAVEQAVEPGRRAELHLRAADCYPDHAVLRADHLARAGSLDAASAYLEAIRRRMANSRWSEAFELANRARKCAESGERWEIDALRARALRFIGRLQASAEAFRELAIDAPDFEMEVEAWIGVAEALRVRGHHQTALQVLERAEEPSRRIERPDLAGHIHYLRGSIYFQTGAIDDCAREHQEALEIAVDQGDRRGEARASSGLADALYMRGEMNDAGTHFDRCVRLARDADFRRIELANLPMLGLTHFYQGDVDHALANIFEALRGAAQYADRRSEMVAANSACDVLAFTGDWPALAEAATRCLGVAQRLGSTSFEALSRAYRGFAEVQSGNVRRGRAEVQAARRIILRDSVEFAGPHVLGLQAAICDDPDELLSVLDLADDLLHETSISHNHLLFRPLAMLAVLRTGLDDDRLGLEAQVDALEAYARSGAPQWARIFGNLIEALDTETFDDAVAEAVRRGFGIAHDFRRAAQRHTH